MGKVEICPQVILTDSATRFKSGGTEYAHARHRPSPLNLKMFRRACRLAPMLGLFPFAWTFEARRSVIFFTNFIYNHYLASKDFTMGFRNHFKVGPEPLCRLQITDFHGFEKSIAIWGNCESIDEIYSAAWFKSWPHLLTYRKTDLHILTQAFCRFWWLYVVYIL